MVTDKNPQNIIILIIRVSRNENAEKKLKSVPISHAKEVLRK